jgi:arsenical pump membrane protein
MRGPLALVAGLSGMLDAVESLGQQSRHLVVLGFAVGIANNLVNNRPLGLLAGATVQAAHPKGLIANAVLIGVDLGPNLSSPVPWQRSSG